MTVEAAQTAQGAPAVDGLKAFVSYRRSDSPSAARQLAVALRERLGAENVFFDIDDLVVGSAWPNEIAQRVRHADVTFVVIGPRWAALADERGKRAVLDPDEEDVMRSEVEAALRARALIVPVVVEGATVPSADRWPRAFRPLAALHVAALRHDTWDSDLEALLSALPGLVTAHRQAGRAAVIPQHAARPPELDEAGEHFLQLIEYLEGSGRLIPVVGSSPLDVDAGTPWEPGCGRLPDRAELACALTKRFRLDTESRDLTRVSQQIVATRGAGDLYEALGDILQSDDIAPGPVHRFLASLPGRLRDRGRDRSQILLTANYDTALERAFDDAGEPYDLAVFMATGEHRGRFVHIPWWDRGGEGAVPITAANAYCELPIDVDGRVERSIIVKLHGGVLHDAPREWRRKHRQNFVITEDDYIDYLSREPIEDLIPFQLLDRLRDSHFLFLGYGIADWSLRVFLQRIWGEDSHGWAVQRSLDRVGRGVWEHLHVERMSVPLAAYLQEFERHLQP